MIFGSESKIVFFAIWELRGAGINNGKKSADYNWNYQFYIILDNQLFPGRGPLPSPRVRPAQGGVPVGVGPPQQYKPRCHNIAPSYITI